MGRFGSDPLAFFNTVYEDVAPWDLGAPQPAMAALLEAYPPAGPVLDLGCGAGDLAIHIATLGHQSLGIDFVPAAIEEAQARRASLPAEIAQRLRFQVADALRPSLLQQTFGAVVDSGFYHLFNRDQCERLIEEVASILRPGGRFYLHEFDIDLPAPNVPRQITEDELHALFTADKGWRIQEVQSAEFRSRVAPPVPAICACIERLPAA